MKKHLLLPLGVLLAIPSFARDFDYTYEGQTISYTVIDEEAKTVKTKDGKWDNPGNEVSGDLILPSVVYDGETKYTLIEIGDYAFSTCISLTSVEIPNSVNSICESAFFDCSSLISIEIPSSVISIGEGAFSGCRSLAGALIIPDSVISIGIAAFYGCGALTSVRIPNSVASIGGQAFCWCDSLESIEVENNNKNYCSMNGVLFSSDKTILMQYPTGKSGQYNIPNTVISIDDWAFAGCSGITAVNIPNSVTSIGHVTFYACTSLTSVTISNLVTYIGNETFSGCVRLTTVVIPNSVTSIGNYAFFGCHDLTSVEISNSLISIGEWTFATCNSLMSVVIPSSVTSIGEMAFFDCRSLTSVVIPDSITEIGNYAFWSCSNIISIEYLSDNPCTAVDYIFDDDIYQKATLYYPMGCKDMFDSTTPWNKFANKVEKSITTKDNNIVVDENDDIDYHSHYEVYNLSGVKVGGCIDNVDAGTYIVRQGSIAKKVSVY